MGQVLGFAHCKEAPSTASTTPDSTEGGNEEPDFSELGGSLDPPEEEEEDEDEAGGGPTGGPGLWGPPRELTFSYIAFKGGGTPRRRGRPPQSRLSSGSPRKSEPPPPPTRTPPKRPEELPPRPPGGELEMGGGLLDWGGPEVEEPPMRLGPPPPPTPPPAPPPAPPKIPEPPPAPPDQSASPLGADGWAAPAGAMEGTVWRLLYWEAPGRSALVLLGTLGTLGCLARFSAVTVLSHAALAALAVTASLRLRRVTLRVLRRHPPPGPPCPAQEGPVGLSPEEQQRWARRLARHLVTATRTLTRLFLVQSVPESLKFAFFFYLLTYVGAVCNGVTLLGAGVICAFTFPVLYRHYQAQIDQYVSLGRNHLSHLRARFKAKLPSAKAKPQ